METSIILICGALVTLLVVYVFVHKSTLKIETAFAGSPSSDVATIDEVRRPKYNVSSFWGDRRVDVSKLIQMVIKGRSLEKEAILDNALVYVRLWNKKDDLFSLPGRFIILKIDNKRTITEHPTKSNYIYSDGKKARKVLRVVPIRMSGEEIDKLCDEILRDVPPNEVERLNLDKQIRAKYEFASEFYSNMANLENSESEAVDTHLIMSLTYRNNGQDLGFSFHSPKFLYGVVEYVNNHNYYIAAS